MSVRHYRTITQQIRGFLMGDKGYLSQPLQTALAQVDLGSANPSAAEHERNSSACSGSETSNDMAVD